MSTVFLILSALTAVAILFRGIRLDGVLRRNTLEIEFLKERADMGGRHLLLHMKAHLIINPNKELIKYLNSIDTCGYECEAGLLTNNVDWQELKALITAMKDK